MTSISLTSSMTSFGPLIMDAIQVHDDVIDYNFSKVAETLSVSRLDTSCIKLSRLAVKKIISKARFTEIQNCKVEEIDVVGHLYLHTCAEKIKKVTATEDIYIDEINSVSEIISKNGTVYVLKNLFTNSYSLKIDKISAPYSSFWYVVESDLDSFTIENVLVKKPINLGHRIKTLFINGDCSKIPEIIFDSSTRGNSVVLSVGAKFFGEVINGTLEMRGLRN